MKYKPLNSNFDELQEETARELLAAFVPFGKALETVKDVIAETIDQYLEAIITQQLAERRFITFSGGPDPAIMFCLGDNNKPDEEQTDLFYTETSLSHLLSELDPEESEESEHADKVASMLEGVASKYRKRQAELKAEEAP